MPKSVAKALDFDAIRKAYGPSQLKIILEYAPDCYKKHVSEDGDVSVQGPLKREIWADGYEVLSYPEYRIKFSQKTIDYIERERAAMRERLFAPG